MSVQSPQAGFRPKGHECVMPTRPQHVLSDISDEDIGRGNPLQGFLIAIPMGAIIWVPLIAIFALR